MSSEPTQSDAAAAGPSTPSLHLSRPNGVQRSSCPECNAHNAADHTSTSQVPAMRQPAESSEQTGTSETDEAKAARVIQKHYRRHADRRKKAEETQRLRMHPEARWDDLLKKQDEQSYADGQLSNKNDVKSRWQRGVKAAARIQRGEGVHTSTATSLTLGPSIPGTSSSEPPTSHPELHDVNADSLGPGGIQLDESPPAKRTGTSKAAASDNGAVLDKETRKKRRARFWGKLTLPKPSELRDEEHLSKELPFRSKALEQQHWLEMVDHKHRYGSNIKFYFRKWKEANTNDNFFRWLDIGEGKNLDLEELPRERLERELITYLSAEQRLNYLVKIDRDGLLRWARNDELVDTAAGKWRDSGNGTGIIPDDTYTGLNPITEEQAYSSRAYRMAVPSAGHGAGSDSGSVSSWTSDSYSAGSELDEFGDTHYVGNESKKGALGGLVKGVTPGGVRDELLRKTIRKNTWIYACDMHLNMFVGIKTSGTFQHSSFLGGGKVTSAGIIVVKHGVIKHLGPWSGHYRSTIEHYRAFIAQLENKGADLSHVKVGKSVMQMWGLGKYTALTKQPQKMANNVKKVLGLKHEPDEMEASREVSRSGEEQEQERKRQTDLEEEGSGTTHCQSPVER